MIKYINTGVAEILAANIPFGSKVWINGSMKGFLHIGDINGNAYSVPLPPGEWSPLGIDVDIHELVCREFIFKVLMPNTDIWFGHITEAKNILVFSTAKEAFASLMELHECYSVNPYEYKLQSTQENFENSKCDKIELQIIEELYNRFEPKTGHWYILIKTGNG